MLRYLAFAWNADSPQQLQLVRSLTAAATEASPEWRVGFELDGLRVLVAGDREPGISVLLLHNRGGIVLGTLFTRVSDGAAISTVTALRHDESRCILATKGRALVDQYWGRYVAFLRDPDDNAIRVIRDPVGEIECLEASAGGVRAFFTLLEDWPLTARSCLTPNWDFIAAALSFPMLDQRETGLREITRVLAGQCVEIRGRNESRTFYWNPASFVRAREISDRAAAIRSLRHTARACVHAWASCYESLLLQLSGGLDSSILVAMLAGAPTRPDVLCANFYCPGDTDSDERGFARIAAARAAKPLVVYEPDTAFDARRLLTMPALQSPSNLLVVVACNEPGWQLARDRGIPATFTGVGGDQLFFVAGASYACADHLFRHGFDRSLVQLAFGAARNRRISFWRVITEGAVLAWRKDRRRRLLGTYSTPDYIAPDAAESVLARQLFLHPWLSDTEDLAPGKVMHILNLADTLGMSVTAPFSAPDDPHYVQPLFSQPLKELCLQIPVPLLAEGGKSRSLARAAFATDLPAEIRSRRTKGGPNAYIQNLVSSNLELMREVVLDGALVKERIVNRAGVEKLLGSALVKTPRAAPDACLIYSTEAWLSGWLARRPAALAA
jgi:asparagine synthase (glutamine-hydrolysing)